MEEISLDSELIKVIINCAGTIISGFVLHVIKYVWFGDKIRKESLKRMNGTATGSSLIFYVQIEILIIITYLLVTAYVHFYLHLFLGEEEEKYIHYYITTAILFVLCFTYLLADFPLKFHNGKKYLGGLGLVNGTVVFICGMFCLLGKSQYNNSNVKSVIDQIFVLSTLGFLGIYLLAISVLDGKKRYHNDRIRLCMNDKTVEKDIIAGTIVECGEWIQYRCQKNGQLATASMKKTSFDKVEYYNLKEKKKLVQINTVCNSSTGHIMHDIQKCAKEAGWDTLSLVGRRKTYTDLPCEKYGSGLSFWVHVIITTLFDRQGHGSLLQTKRLIARLREEEPDVIHLHNLHGYYLHIPTLFRYLKEEYKGRVFWTFHDLWPITGHCAYYTMADCDKWKTQCNNCPNKKVYPVSWGLDRSKKNYAEKKALFTGLEQLEIIAPSNWVTEQVKESFLQNVPVHVISNGIDLKSFHYIEDNGIYEKYNIPKDKKIILGVASIWEKRKGFADFLELAKNIPEEYGIVLVGLDKKQKRKAAKYNIIGIQRTENKKEMAVLYSIADVFMNPSREETFSLVTIEAMACGTPVIALDTSAVKELVNSQNGVVIHDTDASAYMSAIEQLEKKNLKREEIRSTVLYFSEKNMAEKVVELYESQL